MPIELRKVEVPYNVLEVLIYLSEKMMEVEDGLELDEDSIIEEYNNQECLIAIQKANRLAGHSL